MDKQDATRKVLRSLCAIDPNEEGVALENFRNTNLDVLNLEGVEKGFLDLVETYFRRFGGPPSLKALATSAAEEANTALKVYIGEVHVEAQEWGANYQAIIQKYIDSRNSDELSRILLDVSQIQKEGKNTGEEVLRGAASAMEYGVHELTKLKRDSDPYQRAMTKEEAIQKLRQEYAERMANPILAYGLGTGLGPIDDATKGAQNKELWMFAGFTSQGKTTWLLNWTRYLAYEGGFNVAFFSLEMDKIQVWRILACAHSCHPKFNHPLDYEKIKSGTLEAEDADFFLNVCLPDLQDMPGHIEVINPSGPMDIDEIQIQSEILNRERPLDLIVIDYIAILSPTKDQKRKSKQELINDNIVRTKRMAVDFDHGHGVVAASAHQINRAGFKKARDNNGIYEMDAIADANECERSSDSLFCIYQDAPMRQKKEAVITNLKNRDGRIVDPFSVYLPAENRLVAELETVDEEQLSELLIA